MTALDGNNVKTVSLSDFFDAGEIANDPKIPGLKTSDAFVAPDDPLLDVAHHMGIYIGEIK